MSALASAQLDIFLGAMKLGAGLALAYAVPDALRRALSLGRRAVSAMDFLFFLFAGLVSFLYLLSTVDGRVRVFVVAGELLGALLLRLTVYPWAVRMLCWPLRLLIWPLSRLLGLAKALGTRILSRLTRPPEVQEEPGKNSVENPDSP